MRAERLPCGTQEREWRISHTFHSLQRRLPQTLGSMATEDANATVYQQVAAISRHRERLGDVHVSLETMRHLVLVLLVACSVPRSGLGGDSRRRTDASADSGPGLDAGADSGARLDAGADSGPGLDADIDAGPPPTAVMDLALSFVQVKVFRFTWTDASDATFYRLLEDPDGSSGYTQVGGDIPSGTGIFDHEVPLHRRLNASYVLQSCNAAGCTDSALLEVSGTLEGAIGYIKASNTNGGDWFGNSVALSGDGTTLAVGAPYEKSDATGVGGDESDNSSPDAGAVYVFRRTDAGMWSQEAYIKASNTDSFDEFGYSVALSADGTTLAVGAPYEKSDATGVGGNPNDNSAPFAGAVYVFRRSDAGDWSQEAYVKASNTDRDDEFGDSVALSADGRTLAVGAWYEDSDATGVDGNPNDNSAGNAGAVYVFRRSDAGDWSQEAYVKASNTDRDDEFGYSVALSGDGRTLAVGAPWEDSNATGVGGNPNDNSAGNAGAVYVFRRSDAGDWSQEAYVKASNTDRRDLFGYSVALSADGTTLAVGAVREASNARGVGGNAGNNSAGDAGAVYVLRRTDAGVWSQEAYVKASNTDGGDQFGRFVALSDDGRTLAVGAPREDSNATGVGGNPNDNSAEDAGAVYVFRRSGAGVWSQEAYVKASNTDRRDLFGHSVALSADGTTLAVGALWEDSNATGVSGNPNNNTSGHAGAVYLY